MSSVWNEIIKKGEQVLLGKAEHLRLVLSAWLAGGHVLIEDIPGVGKTTLVQCLAQLSGLPLVRLQFTNDMLPGDILGTSIFNSQAQKFEFHKGPLFSNLVLGDELNRATPKTQSAFMQALEEGRVSMDGQTYDLPKPFLFVATQNPFEQVGTFALPEGQLDRFLVSMEIGYPSQQDEKKLIMGFNPREAVVNLRPVTNADEILKAQKLVKNVVLSDSIAEYISNLLQASRGEQGHWPLSPRAGIALSSVARAFAFLQGRDFVRPDDVQSVYVAVASHRLAPTHSQGARIAAGHLKSVSVPL